MMKRNKHTLLILDNATSHNLSNEFFLKQLEDETISDLLTPNINEALYIIINCWSRVDSDTIENCWRHCDIIDYKYKKENKKWKIRNFIKYETSKSKSNIESFKSILYSLKFKYLK